MSGWACLGLVLLVTLLYCVGTAAIIRRDNRAGPRWPGDP